MFLLSNVILFEILIGVGCFFVYRRLLLFGLSSSSIGKVVAVGISAFPVSSGSCSVTCKTGSCIAVVVGGSSINKETSSFIVSGFFLSSNLSATIIPPVARATVPAISPPLIPTSLTNPRIPFFFYFFFDFLWLVY